MPHLLASSSWSKLGVGSLQLPAAPFDQIHDDNQVDDDEEEEEDAEDAAPFEDHES